MTTYLVKQIRGIDQLSSTELAGFVDEAGRLEMRVEGPAVQRPFEVSRRLRAAGYLAIHTWVETDPEDDLRPVSLRVTALRAPEPRTAQVVDLTARRPEARSQVPGAVVPARAAHWAVGLATALVGSTPAARD